MRLHRRDSVGIVVEPKRSTGGGDAPADIDESEIEDLVRRAIRATYPSEILEKDVEYVDVHYEGFDAGSYLLRARAPRHELLTFERWLSVPIDDRTVHFRGAGHAGTTEFYVRARIDSD